MNSGSLVNKIAHFEVLSYFIFTFVIWDPLSETSNPEEIAVSLVAEMLAIRRGGLLRNHEHAIHPRE